MVDYVLDIGCNINCEYSLEFDNIGQFDKHLVSCRVIMAKSGSKEHCKILGLQKELNSTTKARLNELLERLVSSYTVCWKCS